MYTRRLFIELKPPINPENIGKLYEKIKQLIPITGKVSLASKPFAQSVAGFDLSYNLASYLLERHPKLDILYHVTCHDLNRVNIKARLTLLKQLKIKRLLVVSGDGFKRADEPKLRALQFANSHDLAACILNDFNWFESIGVAGYPGGNGEHSFDDQSELDRLSNILQLGASEIYTQCVFDPHSFSKFQQLITAKFPRVRVVPSVALFGVASDLDKIARMTRVNGSSFQQLKKRIDETEDEEASDFSCRFLMELCTELLTHTDTIDLCTFGHFSVAQRLLQDLRVES